MACHRVFFCDDRWWLTVGENEIMKYCLNTTLSLYGWLHMKEAYTMLFLIIIIDNLS